MDGKTLMDRLLEQAEDSNTLVLSNDVRPPTEASLYGPHSATDKLRRYIDYLRGEEPGEIAGAENDRLTPYMNAYAGRLAATADDFRPEEPDSVVGQSLMEEIVVEYFRTPGTGDVQNTLDLKAKGGLSNLFNKMADDGGATILSEFAVVPDQAWHMVARLSPLAQDKKIQIFSKARMVMPGLEMRLGFIQAMPKDESGRPVSFPVMGLNSAIMTKIAAMPDGGGAILDSLAKIATIGNHDMLHHLTSTYINQNVIKNGRIADYAYEMGRFLSAMTLSGGGGDEDPKSYESWALVSHAATWRAMRTGGDDNGLREQVDRYYDALDALSPNLRDEDRVEVGNYLAMLPPLMVSRLVPLNDPDMAHILDRAEPHAMSIEDEVKFPRIASIMPKDGEFPRYDMDTARLQEIYRAHYPGAHIVRKMPDESLEIMKLTIENVAEDFQHVQNFKASRYKDDLPPGMAAMKELGRRQNLSDPEWERALVESMGEIGDFVVDSDANKNICDDMFGQSVVKDSKEFEELRQNFENARARAKRSMNRLMMTAIGEVLDHGGVSPEQKWKAKMDVGQVVFDGLRRSIHFGDDFTNDLIRKTMANYSAAGDDLIGQPGEPITTRQAMMWRLAKVSPEIPYLMSPREPDGKLAAIHRKAETIDRGVLGYITKGGPAAP